MSRELNDIDLKIINLFKSGVTTMEIGKEVGKTKNAICGLISRYREWGYMAEKRFGRPKDPLPKKERVIKEPIRRNPISKSRINYLFRQPKLDKELAKRVIPIGHVSPPVTNGIIFWDLKRTSCRYVLNDGRPETFKFCGEPIHNKAYCAYHASICYMPNERRK